MLCELEELLKNTRSDLDKRDIRQKLQPRQPQRAFGDRMGLTLWAASLLSGSGQAEHRDTKRLHKSYNKQMQLF